MHLVASDAHGIKMRAPSMRRAYESLTAKYGEAVARRLCVENPKAIFFGELPPVVTRDVVESERRKSFFDWILPRGKKKKYDSR